MNMYTPTQQSDESSRETRGAIRWLIRETLGNLVLVGILFGIVGRWDWWNGWALSAIYTFSTLSTAIFILPVNPVMLAERAHLQKDTPKWGSFALTFLGIGTIATYVVAGLDVRWGWSSSLPLSAQLIGFIVAVIGNDILLVWAMVSNAYFVATFRIQSERNHTVVSSGPYRFVRHPGYAGAILLHLAPPLLLNSLWAFIPAILSILVLIARTAVEDNKLQAELGGYKDYAARVHYRLFPGVW